jgi:hypothetical protein
MIDTPMYREAYSNLQQIGHSLLHFLEKDPLTYNDLVKAEMSKKNINPTPANFVLLAAEVNGSLYFDVCATEVIQSIVRDNRS